MTPAELKSIFYQAVYPAKPNEWEVEELLEAMTQLEADEQQMLMSFVHVVWPVSHSLCFSFLEYGVAHVHRLGRDQLAEWVRQLLGWYEKAGLRAARLFMAEVEENFFGYTTSRAAGKKLEDVRGKLLPFVRGVSGRPLELAAASFAWTDTSTIFLPEIVNHFPTPEDNERFFTFLTCCQWAYIVLGTLKTDYDSPPVSGISGQGSGDAGACGIEAFFACFPDPVLARSIFHYLEFTRAYTMLCTELPGLMRAVQPLLEDLVSGHGEQEVGVDRGMFYPLLLPLVRDAGGTITADESGRSTASASVEESCRLVGEMYSSFDDASPNDWERYELFTGRLQFDKVRERVVRRQLEEKQTLIQQLAVLIGNAKKPAGEQDVTESTSSAESGAGSQLLVMLSGENDAQSRDYTLTVNNAAVNLPTELTELLSRIHQDLGHIPEGYVQAAAGIAGRAVLAGSGGFADETLLQNGKDTILYDEWDFRRRGYRKNWCALIEKEIQPVRSHFVQNTLERHRGLILRLRRQFEMLRTQHRFIRRRRHGDDVDFDALVDAVGDRAAGLSPSERLFIRLLRDERDIAVMFLVDMSNSTAGWVGTAIKESLVLLGDVLEIVGDRYGIYGFSGMRRSRCELFRIKRMDEHYNELVQQRICAISPREYTRMAPPIRHLTQMLMATDARVRLIITISDGKPEDYDDYRGEYAIEDTRQALIEARGKGIIPFCITVDQEAHAYLSHMFGEGNYIFVDGVEKLPRRMPEIYRLMTS